MLRVPAEPAYLGLIGTVVQWFGRRAGLSEEQCQELEVAVDEACTNVIRHAFSGQAAGEMRVVCSPSDRGLAVTIVDRGKPFDPEEGIGIAEEKRSRDPASGGMGLLLIHKLTDAVCYRWDEREGNQFTLIKHK
jgi:serine/threonine-protein kinase RsbW